MRFSLATSLAHQAASCRRWGLSLLLAAMFAANVGCAAFRLKNPVPESVAACREFFRKGVDAMECGELNEAETLLRQAAATSPTDADARLHLAETLWLRGHHDEALANQKAAQKLRPEDVVVAVRLGEMYLEENNLALAMQQANAALKLDPKSADVWALRGMIHYKQGQADRALADLQHSLMNDPDDRDVLLAVASLYEQRGQARRRLTTLHHLVDTYPSNEAPAALLAMEGQAYLALGRPYEAAHAFQIASQRGDSSADVLYQLASVEAALGRPVGARDAALRALELDASHGPSQELLAKLSVASVSGVSQRR